MLSDVKEIQIKPGALELAQALNEVMVVLKNPSDAYKQLSEKHTILQKDIVEHGKILEKNKEVLAEYKDSRVKQSLENSKNQQDLDEKTKTLKDLEKNIAARETSAKVRDSALNTKDTQLGEKDAALADKEKKLNDKEKNLIERESAIKLRNAELDKQLGDLHNKHEKLKQVIG